MVARMLTSDGGRRFVYASREPQNGDEATLVNVEEAGMVPSGRINVTIRGMDRIKMHSVWNEPALAGLFFTHCTKVTHPITHRTSPEQRPNSTPGTCTCTIS